MPPVGYPQWFGPKVFGVWEFVTRTRDCSPRQPFSAPFVLGGKAVEHCRHGLRDCAPGPRTQEQP